MRIANTARIARKSPGMFEKKVPDSSKIGRDP